MPVFTIRIWVPGAISTSHGALVVVDLGHGAEDPSGGHDVVAHLDGVDQGLLCAHALLLRTDQQEVEDAAHEDQRQEEGQRVAAVRSLSDESDHGR